MHALRWFRQSVKTARVLLPLWTCGSPGLLCRLLRPSAHSTLIMPTLPPPLTSHPSAPPCPQANIPPATPPEEWPLEPLVAKLRQ